jgi:hypothetical protein
MQLGDIVFYYLTTDDVEHISRRRTSSESIRERVEQGTWPYGAQAHIGSPVYTGDRVPLLVTALHPSVGIGLETISGRCLLNGTDELWVRRIPQGLDAGGWYPRPVETSEAGEDRCNDSASSEAFNTARAGMRL